MSSPWAAARAPEARAAAETVVASPEARATDDAGDERERRRKKAEDDEVLVLFGRFGVPIYMPMWVFAAPEAAEVEPAEPAETGAEAGDREPPAERDAVAADDPVETKKPRARDRNRLHAGPSIVLHGDVSPAPTATSAATPPARSPAPGDAAATPSASPTEAPGPAGPPGAGPEPLSVPTFSKLFAPDMIGPGSVSRLTFTITNPDAVGVTDLAFTDDLPLGMTLAAPGFDRNTCGGTLTADDLTDTIELTGGTLEAMSSCIVRVNVTAGATGGLETTYMNVSDELMSSAGDSGTAADDLTVKIDRPGFTKVFSPSSVAFGGRSTLTFTIDNALNTSALLDVDFTDTLPAGMVVASPSNKTTTCTVGSGTGIIAVPGSSVISFDASALAGVVGAGGTCTVSVDVIGGAVGDLGNVSGELNSFSLAFSGSSGRAANVLEVSGFAALLSLEKTFLDNPVAPGGTTKLRFKVTNRSRDDSAMSITFTDDLEMTLTGLAPTGLLPTDPCGAGSSLSFSMGDLTLIGGGPLGPGESCTFDVTLLVPSGATPDTYPNTAGPVSGDVGGSPETGNIAADQLFVVTFPALGKEWTDDPVGAGDSVTLKFTIQNTSTASAMSSIAFEDQLTSAAGDPSEGGGVGPQDSGFLPFPVSVTLPGGTPCGGSVSLVSCGTDCQALSLTGGSLTANDGMPMGTDECSFTVTVDIPVGFPGGSYLNTTQEITAVLDGIAGMPTVEGPPASDTLVVEGTPTLTKEFIDDPVAPGGSVTLLFTLTHDEAASGEAMAIAFEDDLAAAVPGGGLMATMVGVPNTCAGSTVDIMTDPTKIDFFGGSLMPGDECSFSVTITVPGGAPSGVFTNTTSDVTATVGGVMATGNPAEDDLLITGLLFSKSFIGDPAIAGGPVTLMFTLDNTLGAVDATMISFSDDLSSIIPPEPGVTTTGPPTPPMPCGGTLTDFGGTFLFFSGGTVLAGTSCSFTVPLLVPATIDPDGGGPMPPFPTPDDAYANVTSSLFATIGGPLVILPPAVDELIVQTENLALTKKFTNDPAIPGGEVTLEFTLENLHPTGAASAIAFDDDLGAALAGLEITSELTNTCGGTVGGVLTDMFSYTGGSLAASDGMPGGLDTCTIELLLTLPPAPLAGDSFPNTTGPVSGTIGGLPVTGEPASDTLEVDTLIFTKSFADSSFAGGTVVLTFTLTNLDATAGVTPIAFGDNLDLVISGLVATGLPASDVCGSGSTLSGTAFVSLSGGSLAAAGSPGDSCTFDVTLSVPGTATAGDFLNTTTAVSQFGIPVAAPALDFLTIKLPPVFSKVFAPDAIPAGGISTLTFTIDNTASADVASSLAFTDVLPAGVVIASPPGTANTCGGAVTAVAGSGTIALSGGMVAVGMSCTLSVKVTSSVPGAYLNETGDLTSSSGNSGTAADTLTVAPLVPPTFSKLFAPDAIDAGMVSTLTFTIDNTASALAASDLAFTDSLSADLFIASPPSASNTCGGTLTAAAGGGVIALSGGTVAAGAVCKISVKVTSVVGALYVNTTGDLTSSLGNSGSATDVLTVTGLADLSVTFIPVYDPVVGASIQLYLVEVANAGPSPAEDVLLDFELPVGSFFLGAEPTSVFCMLFLPSSVFCELDDLAPGGSTIITIGAFVDGRFDGIRDSEALVDSAVADPDPANNEDDASVEVARPRSIVATTRADGTEILAMLAKEADSTLGLIFAEAEGGGARKYSVTSSGFRAVSLAEVPNFAGTVAPEVAVLGFGFDGSVKVDVVDADSAALLGSHPVAGGPWLPIDLVALPDVGGPPSPDLAILTRDLADGSVHTLVIDAGDGTLVADHLVAGAGEVFPIDLDLAPDFDGTPTPELAILSKNRSTEVLELRVVDGASGAPLGPSPHDLGDGLFPFAVEVLDDIFGTPAPDAAVLLGTGAGLTGVGTLDLSSGGTGFAPLFDPLLQPKDLEVVPDFAGGPAPELAVLGLKGLDVVVEIRDAGNGTLGGTLVDSDGLKLPVPLGLAVHPSFTGGAEPDVSVLFEFDSEDAQVNVFDAAGGLPLFNFFLP